MHSCSRVQDERLESENGAEDEGLGTRRQLGDGWEEAVPFIRGRNDERGTAHPGLTGSSDELNVNAALQLSPATRGRAQGVNHSSMRSENEELRREERRFSW